MSPFPANVYPCRITRVVDGDTVHAAVNLGFRVAMTLPVRLTGVWVPELFTGDLRDRGRAARDYVEVWVQEHQLPSPQYPLLFACSGHQSFNRWLGSIRTHADVDLASSIITSGHGTLTKEGPPPT